LMRGPRIRRRLPAPARPYAFTRLLNMALATLAALPLVRALVGGPPLMRPPRIRRRLPAPHLPRRFLRIYPPMQHRPSLLSLPSPWSARSSAARR
jgi:hypothetical protein